MMTTIPTNAETALSHHVRDWESGLNVSWHPLAREWATGLRAPGGSQLQSEHIFPAVQPGGSRHLFKAFDGISPSDVRVVLLGQDPYSDEQQATGRAFEQGNLEAFTATTPRVTKSLNHMLRKMVEATVDEKLTTKGVNLRELLAQKTPHVGSMTETFDNLSQQGVLFLNASLTIPASASRSNNKHLPSHLAFWRPFVRAILLELLMQPKKVPIFLLMGKTAQSLFDQMAGGSIDQYAERVVRTAHPSANTFSNECNPFIIVNKHLSAADCPPINWLRTQPGSLMSSPSSFDGCSTP